VIAYTDGSCLGNPGPGGWAWTLVGGPSASGAERFTTNQRMELTAALEVMQWMVDHAGDLASRHGDYDVAAGDVAAGGVAGELVRVTIISDSSYLVTCFGNRWWEGWLKRGWRNAKGDAVANRDLWEPLLQLVLDGPMEVNFSWTRGHSGDAMNELVDAMANEAARTQRGRAPA